MPQILVELDFAVCAERMCKCTRNDNGMRFCPGSQFRQQDISCAQCCTRVHMYILIKFVVLLFEYRLVRVISFFNRMQILQIIRQIQENVNFVLFFQCEVSSNHFTQLLITCALLMVSDKHDALTDNVLIGSCSRVLAYNSA